MSEEKKGAPYYEQIAAQVIEGLKNGTAPFIKPWEAGTLQRPHNPLSGSVYRGANWVSLMMQEREDPRWATYKQAQAAGWQVRKGEKGTSITYFSFTEKVKKKDKQGNIVRDAEGRPVEVTLTRDKPIIWSSKVFNVEQMDNVPPLPAFDQRWNEVERVEALLDRSKAQICHDQSDRAFYSYLADSIHLPKKEQFPKQEYYYETAMHELAHWTGHHSRLDRDMRNPFGSAEYAREELRAELASFMLSQELGLSHGLGRTTSYVESWIEVLQNNPKEIVSASKDAECILQYVLQFEQIRAKEYDVMVTTETAVAQIQVEAPAYGEHETMRVKVPFAEKEEFKSVMHAHGARAKWDQLAKEWRVPAGVPKEALQKWLTSTKEPSRDEHLSEFARRVSGAGLILDAHPQATGEIQRVPVEGAKPHRRDGAYALYENEDGGIAGWYQNFRTGERGSWGIAGRTLSGAQQQEFAQLQEERRFRFERERSERYEELAMSVEKELARLPQADQAHAYLKKKEITAYKVHQNERGELVVPLRDLDGKVWSTQTIREDGTKRYLKDGRKKGLFAEASDRPLQDGQPIFIAEGYATARSAALAHQATALASLDVYNLEAVAEDIRAKFPNSPIIILGDDDAEQALNTGSNIGREQALKVASAIDAVAIFPDFAPLAPGKERSDFNDLQREMGTPVVARQLDVGVILATELVREEERDVANDR